MALQNTMAYVLLAAASQGIAVVVYEAQVEVAARPVMARVRLVAYIMATLNGPSFCFTNAAAETRAALRKLETRLW